MFNILSHFSRAACRTGVYITMFAASAVFGQSLSATQDASAAQASQCGAWRTRTLGAPITYTYYVPNCTLSFPRETNSSADSTATDSVTGEWEMEATAPCRSGWRRVARIHRCSILNCPRGTCTCTQTCQDYGVERYQCCDGGRSDTQHGTQQYDVAGPILIDSGDGDVVELIPFTGHAAEIMEALQDAGFEAGRDGVYRASFGEGIEWETSVSSFLPPPLPPMPHPWPDPMRPPLPEPDDPIGPCGPGLPEDTLQTPMESIRGAETPAERQPHGMPATDELCTWFGFYQSSGGCFAVEWCVSDRTGKGQVVIVPCDADVPLPLEWEAVQATTDGLPPWGDPRTDPCVFCPDPLPDPFPPLRDSDGCDGCTATDIPEANGMPAENAVLIIPDGQGDMINMPFDLSQETRLFDELEQVGLTLVAMDTGVVVYHGEQPVAAITHASNLEPGDGGINEGSDAQRQTQTQTGRRVRQQGHGCDADDAEQDCYDDLIRQCPGGVVENYQHRQTGAPTPVFDWEGGFCWNGVVVNCRGECGEVEWVNENEQD